MSRRTFIAGTAALTVGGLTGLGACAPSSRSAAARRRGSRPFPNRPEGADSLPQLAHIVVLMMENHSFDNYLGVLGRGDGLRLDENGTPANTNPDPRGRRIRSFPMPSTCQLVNQPASDWFAAHRSWNGGANDGFVRSPSGAVAMGHFTRTQLPFYFSLAETFPICDRWFAPALAGTFVNRRFALAATSLGLVRRPNKVPAELPPSGTILDALDRHEIPWRNYYVDQSQLRVFPALLDQKADKLQRIDAFFAAAASGALPGVSFVDPAFERTSEENPQDVRDGEAFAASVVRAVMRGPAWASTLLVWCYDEGGGYYDHVPPPPATEPDDRRPELAPGDPAGRFDRLGFRVPAAVVSPWSRPGYVSHAVRDHTSILKLIERKWNLPSLTARDGAASDLFDCLDFENRAFLVPPTLADPARVREGAACVTPSPADFPPPAAVR